MENIQIEESLQKNLLKIFEEVDGPTLSERINEAFEPLVDFMEKIFFWDPVAALGFKIEADVPFIVLWVVLAGIFFTLWMKFINIRAFRHSLDLVRGKYNKPGERGEVSHFQALATALSATVGLGNISGVAIAIVMGGPGATFWMIIAGFFGMSLKFTECTLGVKYRRIGENGIVSGGPMYYLVEGLKKKNLAGLGKVLAALFALLIVASAMGGNMFQANQAFAQFLVLVPSLQRNGAYFGIFLALLVGLVIIGGIKSIGRVTGRIVPFMAVLYLGTAMVIIIMNVGEIGNVFKLIVTSAFDAPAIKGGLVGVLITGFRRGAFSNEAGLGSSAIAHAPAKTEEPVNEGIVALMEPFIDTIIICTMTSLVLIFTGFHQNPEGLEGTRLTSAAFGSVFPWFPYLLVGAILLFAYSTMISWSYYGVKGFDFLLGGITEKYPGKRILATRIFTVLLLLCVIIGASSSLSTVISFLDMVMITLAIPNVIGLVILGPEVRRDLKDYMKRLKAGEIPENPRSK
ncbi:MAG: alanine:cation symporter family protein [Bacteroidales bacterium]|nr:MAG: alanine:cation symporter family protein [Bacteroidales bacterium]